MKKPILKLVLLLGGIAAFAFTTQNTGTELPPFYSDSSFSIAWAMDNNSIHSDKDHVYFYTELRGGKVAADPNRKHLNLALVIDRSGSMGGLKIEYAKKAAHTLVQNLQSGDHFALVDYDEQISTPVFSTVIGENRKAINKEVDKLYARGSTNLCGGMLEGFKQAKVSFNKDFINRVLLFSDGIANVGVISNLEIQKMAKSKLEETGISLSSFGIGSDFNEQLMTHLAEYGNGNYYFINNPDNIPTQLAAELNGLLSTVAQNLQLNLQVPENEYTVEKVYGGNFTFLNNTVSINIGNVTAEETHPVLIKLKRKTKAVADEIFNASVIYNTAKTGIEKKVENAFKLMYTQDKSEWATTQNSVVWNAVQAYDLNEIMESAMMEMERGNQAKAKVYLDTIRSPRFEIFVSDTVHFITNSTVVRSYQIQAENNATYSTKSYNEQKVILKNGRADSYKFRAKGKIK